MNDGFPEECVGTLNALEKFGFDRIIPVHGEVAPREQLRFFRSYLTDIIASVKQAVSDGASLEEMKKWIPDQLAAKYEKGMSKYPLGQYRDRIALNIEMTYRKVIAKG